MIELIRPNTPDQAKLDAYLRGIAERGYYTNHGPLVTTLEQRLSDFSAHERMMYVANGTLALQLALKLLTGNGRVLTTPYSYVATTNAALWQGNQVDFVDVTKETFFPDPSQVEAAITDDTKALLFTHVYGLPGPIEAYRAIADEHGIPLIMDAAHAFDVRWKGKALDGWSDIACYSFHATKTFHTVEGGAIALSDSSWYEKLFNYRSFGHRGDNYYDEGINAKGSEVHAAYGLAQLDQLKTWKEIRQQIFERYANQLGDQLRVLEVPDDLEWNYGYFPIVFDTGVTRADFEKHMANNGIRTRRYFYPSLNQLPHVHAASCPNAEDLADRVQCIPLHAQLAEQEVTAILSSTKAFLS